MQCGNCGTVSAVVHVTETSDGAKREAHLCLPCAASAGIGVRQGALATHFISSTTNGEKCRVCRHPATHKLGEEIAFDDPAPVRHNLTAYVCCAHFSMVVGPASPCTSRDVMEGGEGSP